MYGVPLHRRALPLSEATPERPDDADNPVRTIMGNGLRPDLWLDFKKRFGIERVAEFYAASEGNVSFANFLNKDCTIGLTANRVAVVEYDVDADEIVRGDDGMCRNVASGEPGLLLGHINPNARFEGYTDAEATERKVVRNAFEEGDAWFNTGDLIREVDAGFTLGYPHYQFVDRVGDTFRWKSENVSTNEVGEILNGFEDVEFCNVYGVEVPGSDGRAGMAAVRLARRRRRIALGCARTVGESGAAVLCAAHLRAPAVGHRRDRYVQDGEGGSAARGLRHHGD